MKIFNLLLISVLITCAVASADSARSDAKINTESDWEFIGGTNDVFIFFDKPTLKQVSTDKYSVGLRYELTETGKNGYIKTLSGVTKDKNEIKQIQDMLNPLAYVIHLIELDTKDKSFILKTVVHFDDNNYPLYGYDEQKKLITYISPRTVNEAILNAVVNYAKNK